VSESKKGHFGECHSEPGRKEKGHGRDGGVKRKGDRLDGRVPKPRWCRPPHNYCGAHEHRQQRETKGRKRKTNSPNGVMRGTHMIEKPPKSNKVEAGSRKTEGGGRKKERGPRGNRPHLQAVAIQKPRAGEKLHRAGGARGRQDT